MSDMEEQLKEVSLENIKTAKIHAEEIYKTRHVRSFDVIMKLINNIDGLIERLEAYQEVVVGDFTIQEGETKDSVILKKADGEGGGFDKSLFEKYLTIFFDENF